MAPWHTNYLELEPENMAEAGRSLWPFPGNGRTNPPARGALPVTRRKEHPCLRRQGQEQTGLAQSGLLSAPSDLLFLHKGPLCTKPSAETLLTVLSALHLLPKAPVSHKTYNVVDFSPVNLSLLVSLSHPARNPKKPEENLSFPNIFHQSYSFYQLREDMEWKPTGQGGEVWGVGLGWEGWRGTQDILQRKETALIFQKISEEGGKWGNGADACEEIK